LHTGTISKAQQLRQGRPLLVADLAVPRDADPAIAFIPGVRLTNIDDLAVAVKNGHTLAASLCQEVEAIVQEELDSFRRWCDARRCAPLIGALYLKAETIYQAEVEQTLRRLGPLTSRQERLVQAMGKAIAGKLLHEPTAWLRELPRDADISSYIEVIEHLYGIQ
jgi:glutamyl-tRNA reductase